MTKVYCVTTFFEGDDVALPLPDEIAFPVDISVMIERRGGVLKIWPKGSPPPESWDGEQTDF